jgi:HEAT repeat protein
VGRKQEGVMKQKRIGIAFLALILVLSIGLTVYAQPNLPKENIPATLPPEVKAEVEGLYSPEAAKRAQAAEKLGNMGDKAAPAIPYLIGLLGDTTGVKVPLEPGSNVMTDTSAGIEASTALGKIGDPALDPLIAALKDKNPHVRILAAAALEELESPKAVEPLIAALKDENPDVRSTWPGPWER